MTEPRRVSSAALVVLIVAAQLAGAAVAVAAEGAGEAVLVTDHFALWSDFETNLNDALTAAGRARPKGQAELFHSGAETACFAALPAAERAGWERAVDYYAEIVSVHDTLARTPTLLRLSLAGVVGDDEWDTLEERRFVEIGRGMRSAAAPAYRECRWPAQDRANRRFIEELAPRLAAHEEILAARLVQVFATPWKGLPFRVDVVETVDYSGANSVLLRPPGAHVLISSSNPGYRGPAALEMIFHEACHFLAGRGTPLRVALTSAEEELGSPFRGDLVHAVHFYTTGEVVRRALEQAGEPAYTPYLYAQDLFDGGTFRRAIETTWPAYLDGERTLAEAARDLLLALRVPEDEP